MGKTLELAFALAGKLLPSFSAATGEATAELGKIEEKTKAISAAAQKRQDAAAFKGLKKAAGETGDSFGKLSREVVGTAAIITGAATAAAGAIYGIASSSANTADAAIKNAQGIGMSTEAYTQLAYAANMSGVGQQDFIASTVKMTKTMKEALDGNKSAMDMFERAGVSLRNSKGDIKTAEEMYSELADVFASMPDGIGKTTLASELFGRTAGAKMIPMLNGGSEAINALREDAKRLGISLSETDAKNAEAFNDSFANIGVAMSGVSLTIGKVLWPVLTRVHTAIEGWISANGALLSQKLPEWITKIEESLPELEAQAREAWATIQSGAKWINDTVQSMGGWYAVIKMVAKAWLAYRGLRIATAMYSTASSVAALGKQFIATIPAMKRFVIAKAASVKGALLFGASVGKTAVLGLGKMALALGKATLAAGKFALALLMNPIGLVITGIAALVAAAIWCYYNWDTVVGWLTAAWEWMSGAASVAFEAISAAFAAAWEAAKGVFVAGWSLLPGWIQEPLTEMWESVSAVGGKILGAFGIIFDDIKAFFSGRLSAVVDAFDKGFVSGLLEAVWQFSPVSILMDIMGKVKDYFAGGVSTVIDAFDGGIVNGLKEALWQFNPVVIVGGLLNDLVKYLFDFDLAAAGKALIDNLAQSILNAWASVKDGIVSAVTDWIPGGGALVEGAGAVVDGAKSAAGWVGDKVSSIWPFAEGGVITSPQMGLVGEDGPEVIIPVSKPARARSLMDTAAGMMGLSPVGGEGGIAIDFHPSIRIDGATGNTDSIMGLVRRELARSRDDLLRILDEREIDRRRVGLY